MSLFLILGVATNHSYWIYIPDGDSWVVDTLKLSISILCTSRSLTVRPSKVTETQQERKESSNHHFSGASC